MAEKEFSLDATVTSQTLMRYAHPAVSLRDNVNSQRVRHVQQLFTYGVKFFTNLQSNNSILFAFRQLGKTKFLPLLLTRTFCNKTVT